jgi:hypothetical protein
MLRTISAVISLGAGLPGISAVVMMMSTSRACLCIHLALRCLKALAHDLGVTAAARAFFLVVHLDELATQRHHLVGHFGARVVGAHDGAQAGCRANGGQTGHTGTGNEHLGRRHLARGRDLAVEEAAECIGRFDHRAVAADTGHGGQRVHFLGAAECAGQRVDGQHGGFGCASCCIRSGFWAGQMKPISVMARAHHGHFVGAGWAHLEHDVDVAHSSAAVGTMLAPARRGRHRR